MKAKLLLIVLVFLMRSISTYGDVIPWDSHSVIKCVKITNVDDYPDISLVGFILPVFGGTNAYTVSSSACLTKGYKYNDFKIYAVSKTYLEGKDILKIDFPRVAGALPANISIEPFGGYMHDTIPISGIDEFYKIAGFTETNVILYKWKQITRYNNGKADLTETFEYEGNVAQLQQKIGTGIRPEFSLANFELYPNPAYKSINLKIHNLYTGDVMVEIINMGGKVAKSFTVNKLMYTKDTDIHINDLRSGVYFVTLKFGNYMESKKMVIK